MFRGGLILTSLTAMIERFLRNQIRTDYR